VASTRWHAGRLLVGFAGLDDRTAAEAVRGVRLVVDVDPDERPEDPGEYYDRQLVGLEVRTAEGAPMGEVVAVLHLPAQDVLEVRTADGPRLVPFVADLVPEVDLEHQVLTVADRAGLLAEIDEG
jgi:16S rRNA processing protein RimM